MVCFLVYYITYITDSDISQNEANNENESKNDTPFDSFAFALKVLENEAAEIKPKEAWPDGDADNEVSDIDGVEKKNVKKFRIRKWFGRLFGGCVRINEDS